MRKVICVDQQRPILHNRLHSHPVKLSAALLPAHALTDRLFYTCRCVFIDSRSHCKDHEGVLVPEPIRPPHGPAGEEDPLQTGTWQRLHHRQTEGGHLDLLTKMKQRLVDVRVGFLREHSLPWNYIKIIWAWIITILLVCTQGPLIIGFSYLFIFYHL